MSFQEQPQLQQQQPGLVYPDSATSSSYPPPTSHSSGSFGAVFIVLAVIVVVSAIACFLSRFLTKRHHHRSTKQTHHHHHQQGPPMPRPEKREPKQGHHGNFNDTGDIEFGFGKGMPNGKQFANGAKIKPQVRFDFGRDPRMVGDKGFKGGDFGVI